MRRRLGLAAVFTLMAMPAAAQTAMAPPPAEASTSSPALLSRFDFSVGMEHISSEDQRFVWDAYWGAELDLVDYGAGRLMFAAAYQTILGEEFRIFDPNQGNYMLAGSASARAGALEVAGVFHHVSRHLSDRPKRFPVDWNMIGARVLGSGVRGRTELRGRVDLRRVIQRSFVDYEWELDGETVARIRVAPRAAIVAGGGARILGVDESRGRGTQYGLRGEGGIRFDGGAAALELFVAAERRIDPYQLEFATATWVTAGFRLISR